MNTPQNNKHGADSLPPRKRSANRAAQAVKVRRGAGAQPLLFRLSDRRERPWSARYERNTTGRRKSKGSRSTATRAPCTPKLGRGNNLQNNKNQQGGDRWWTPCGTPYGTPYGTASSGRFQTVHRAAIGHPCADGHRAHAPLSRGRHNNKTNRNSQLRQNGQTQPAGEFLMGCAYSLFPLLPGTRRSHTTNPTLASVAVREAKNAKCHGVDSLYSFPSLTMENSTTTKPVKVFRLRGVSASVFENRSKAKGRDVPYFKVSLQRTYKDGDEFKSTTSLSRDDLPIADLLIRKSWAFILDAEEKRHRDASEERIED